MKIQLVIMLSSARIMSPSWTVLCILSIAAGCCHLSRAQQLVPSNTLVQTQASANITIGPNSSLQPAAKLSSELQNFEEFKKSPLFVEPFDPAVISLPEQHLAFVRKITKEDIAFYKTILNESIAKRNKLAASVRLMLKYGGRLLANLIKHRREENKLTQKVEPKPAFYLMLADILTEIADSSSQLKRNYSKNTINIEAFRLRVETIFDTFEQTVAVSPMGPYLNWTKCIVYKDRPQNGIQNRRLVDEVSDLIAQFRVMGYDNTSFMIRRIANLARMFARGVVPASEKDLDKGGNLAVANVLSLGRRRPRTVQEKLMEIEAKAILAQS